MHAGLLIEDSLVPDVADAPLLCPVALAIHRGIHFRNGGRGFPRAKELLERAGQSIAPIWLAGIQMPFLEPNRNAGAPGDDRQPAAYRSGGAREKEKTRSLAGNEPVEVDAGLHAALQIERPQNVRVAVAVDAAGYHEIGASHLDRENRLPNREDAASTAAVRRVAAARIDTATDLQRQLFHEL